MNDNLDFELKRFQSEVYQEFHKLKAVNGVARLYSQGIESIQNYQDFFDNSFSSKNLLRRSIFGIFSLLGKGAKKNIIDKSEFKAREVRSAEILDNPTIKGILCRALRKEIKSDLFLERTYAKMVRIVTASLTKPEIAEEFSIKKDAQLYSLMVYNILQRGVGNYCVDAF